MPGPSTARSLHTPQSIDRSDDRGPVRASAERASSRPVERKLERPDNRRLTDDGRYSLDLNKVPDGYVMEWKRHSVMGMNDTRNQVLIRQFHWEPVPHKMQPHIFGHLVAPGKEDEHIIVDGMGLYMRPAYLNIEANAETRYDTDHQLSQQLQSLRLSSKDQVGDRNTYIKKQTVAAQPVGIIPPKRGSKIMANVLSPKGFGPTSLTSGVTPNFGLIPGKMAYNASATYRGDAAILTAGKIAVATVTGNSGAAVVGIIDSFSWVSIAQKQRVWSSYYPGNDSQANADVDVLFNGNPDAQFQVQLNAGIAVQADIGSVLFNFATGTPNTYSGLSGMSLDYSTKNASQGTLPFVLVSIVQAPVSDPTTAYNQVVVGFATQTKF